MAASGVTPGYVNGILCAVDSGKDSGFAIFADGELVSACLRQLPKDGTTASNFQAAVVEIPDRIRVNPKSIIKLALNAGAWLQYFGGYGRPVEAIEASAWKASTDPDILARRILACLTPAELARVPKTKSALGYNHNVVDAIGLGLWRLGRMGRGGRKIQ